MAKRHVAALLCGAAMIIGSSSAFIKDGGVVERVAEAKPKKKSKSLSRCIRYGQEKGEDEQSVQIRLRNRCKVKISCSIEWKLQCDGEEASEESSSAVKLESGATDFVTASAVSCGDRGWAVDDIKWDCEPM